jgi:DNA-binding response OmpR family regulator
MQASVAILEDDVALREDILVPQLGTFGFSVEGFGTSSDLYRRMLAVPFDLLVLDIGLPDEDGFDVARYLRATSPIGIVTLSGRAANADRVKGLTEAVDAWLVKPVEIDVLAATLHSLARRMQLAAAVEGTSGAAGWRLPQGSWRLHAPDGRSVPLNLLERSLVTRLLVRPGQLVSHAELIVEVAATGENFDQHRLEMLIHRLRRKVEQQLGESLPLRSVRGRGYVMLAADERQHGG